VNSAALSARAADFADGMRLAELRLMDIANRNFAEASFVSQQPLLPALEASGAPARFPLSRVWPVIRSGAAVIRRVDQTSDRLSITLERRRARASISATARRRLDVLERLLLGESSKVVAFELHLSMSTIATDRASASMSLGLKGDSARSGLFLVMAVHAAFGFIDPPVRIEQSNETHITLSVDRPSPNAAARLSRSEREVLRQFVDGDSRPEIAVRRKKSIRTVSNQLASAFRKLRVSGRRELLAKLACESASAVERPSSAVVSAPRPVSPLRGTELASNLVWMSQALANATASVAAEASAR
jgi:DNA-binding NarL/FixJ family response regulator